MDAILSLYQIDIEYDTKRKVYFINDNQQPEVSSRLLEAFAILNALKINDRIAQFVHFEKRKSKGTENFHGLLHAIRNRTRITFDFKDYWQNEPIRYEAEPFGLKEFKNRWYVLAKNLADGIIKKFALDRLTKLEITPKVFKANADYNIDRFYENYFGIITSDEKEPEEIILQFDDYQANYIKSLPLHTSQEIIPDTENGLQIKLRLFITYDFIMEILSFGDTVTVIKPEKLKGEIKCILQKSLAKYN